jgi:hypothetical protein
MDSNLSSCKFLHTSQFAILIYKPKSFESRDKNLGYLSRSLARVARKATATLHSYSLLVRNGYAMMY